MKKLSKMFKALMYLIIALVVFLFIGCDLIGEEPEENYCWLADKSLSENLDKVQDTYYLDDDEEKIITLCFNWLYNQQSFDAKCVFNESQIRDVSPTCMQHRYFDFKLSPKIKEGKNTFDVYFLGKSSHFEIYIYKKDSNQ